MGECPVDSELAKRIELAKKEWETTVDTIHEGIALYDTETLAIRRVNWPFAKLFNSTPKKIIGGQVHEMLCGCEEEDCPVLSLLLSPIVDSLDVWRVGSGQYWSLNVYPISEISGSHSHFKHNVVVIRDITEERQLQQRIVEAEKHAYMVELVDHLIDRVNPSVDSVREELGKISGHVVALREIIRRVEDQIVANEDNREKDGYPEIAFKEIEQAMRQSGEYLDRINEVIGCLDELEISTGHMQRSEINIDS